MATTQGRVVIPVQVDRSPPAHDDGRHDIAGTDHVSPAIIESLAPTQIVVLGYWPVPDQSSPQQLRDQFEAEARETLDRIKEPIEGGDVDVITELSFTKDRDHLIDRVANKHDCTSVLFPGTIRSTRPESVLVLLKSDSDMERIVTTLGTLFEDTDVDILLFHAVEGGDDVDATEYMLRGVADRLTNRGIDREQIHLEQSDRGSRVDTIVSEVANHDLVVLSESNPSIRERIFGPVQSGITDKTDRPSLTIRANT